jgi:heme oxygenase (biliverdin-IX-beta and delta-forming)
MRDANRRLGSDGAVPLRFLLRQATAEAHAALHELPAFSGLARSVIGRADYARLIQRMESFYAALDPALAAAGGRLRATPGAAHRARAPVLARDLADAGLSTERPGPAAPAAFGCAASYAGALYVVDGALLGGAVLGRAAGRLDWRAPSGFWRWAETEGPGLWRRTLVLIERVDAGEASRGSAVAAAMATFAAFGQWMERPVEQPAGVT